MTTGERIAGIAIGELGNVTRIPRRALDCTSPAPSDPRDSCAMTIDGELLKVDVERLDRRSLRFAACEAFYEGLTATCRAVWFSLTGGFPLYAFIPAVQPGQPHETVQWLGPGVLQRVQAPHLEVREEALRAIRQQYVVENFYEADWLAVIGITASTVALVVAVLAFVLMTLQRPLREAPLLRLGAPLASLVVPAICGVTAFGLSYVVLTILAMGASFVD